MNPSITKDWAEWQTTVFETGKCPVADFLKWSAVCGLQEKICPTNLTLRQNAIGIAVADIFGDNPYRQIFISQFNALHRNGYAVEGKSYWDFIQPALAFIKARTGGDIIDPAIIQSIEDNYGRLVFPDGSLPLPEVSADVRLPFDPTTAEDSYEDDSYLVRRWFAPDRSRCVAQLLVCKDTNPDPRANLHYHMAAGYFCFWLEGQGFLNRVADYKGFDLLRGAANSDVAACLPKGAMPPTWRVNPPRVTMTRKDSGFNFAWFNMGDGWTHVERRVTWGTDFVSIEDNGVARRYDIPQQSGNTAPVSQG